MVIRWLNMENRDKEEIIDNMMKGSELIRKNRNKGLKVFRKRTKDGKASKSYKKRLGKHLNLSPENEVGEE